MYMYMYIYRTNTWRNFIYIVVNNTSSAESTATHIMLLQINLICSTEDKTGTVYALQYCMTFRPFKKGTVRDMQCSVYLD